MSEKTKNYATMIGDLVDSRLIADRGEFQHRLASGLAAISRKDSVCSPFTVTLGDEFQAVFATGTGLLRSLFEIRSLIYPVKCRFSIAMGHLDTELNPKQAIGMDGPAFHLARQGMESLKKSKQHLHINGWPSPTQEAAEPITRLLWATTSNWHRNRLQILTGMLRGTSEQKQAVELAISEQSVYKNIREAQLHDWVELVGTTEARITSSLQR